MQSPASSPGVGSEVKFVFTAVGQAGQDLQLQEVELFGPSGQLAVLSATNPGGKVYHDDHTPIWKVHDGYITGNCWADTQLAGNVATSTLELAFSSAVTFAAYDLFSGRTDDYCPPAGYPTSWQLFCKASTADAHWSLVDTRTNVTAPASAKSSYSLSAGEG